MDWNKQRKSIRRDYNNAYNTKEAINYGDYPDVLYSKPIEARRAYYDDISDAVAITPKDMILDFGSGTGVFTSVFVEQFEIPEKRITAVDPSQPMLSVLNEQYPKIKLKCAFIDLRKSRHLFKKSSFNLIVSRYAANGLADPLRAFKNIYRWLKPGGHVILVDGMFSAAGWFGTWHQFVHALPCSANQSRGLFPYLLEKSGFTISAVRWMAELNDLVDDPENKEAMKYLVVARKQ